MTSDIEPLPSSDEDGDEDKDDASSFVMLNVNNDDREGNEKMMTKDEA